MESKTPVVYGQVVGITFGFLSLACGTITCSWNEWSVSSGSSASYLLSSISGFNGIWMQCLQHTSGQFQCDDYSVATSQLPLYMLTIRGMMCLALFFISLGCVLAMVGMQCNSMIDNSEGRNRNVIWAAISCFILGGVLIGVSISWFIAMIVTKYLAQSNQSSDLTYEVGRTMWVGVATVVFSWVTSIIFCCFPGAKKQQNFSTLMTDTPCSSSFDHDGIDSGYV